MIRSLFHRSRDRALSMTLSPLTREILRQHLTLLTPQKLQAIEQHAKLMDRRKIDGDFIECGMHLGGSAIVLASLLGRSRRFRGYETSSDPADERRSLERSFAAFGLAVDGRRIALHRVAPDRVPIDTERPVALAHINCEWPTAGLVWLNAVAPQMAGGGVILVNERNDRGDCRNAMTRFTVEHPDFALESDVRGASVLHCTRPINRFTSIA